MLSQIGFSNFKYKIEDILEKLRPLTSNNSYF